MTEIPIFEDIVSQINEWIFTDQTVIIVVGIFVLVISLSLFGARRMEEN